MLAVLTSNLLVSLWEPLSTPTESTSWYRSCVLNHALHEHRHNVSGNEFPSRRQARIRAVTWCCEPPKVDGCWKRLHLLAVANDDGDLYLLRLNRTHKPRRLVAQVLLLLPTNDFPRLPADHTEYESEWPLIDDGRQFVMDSTQQKASSKRKRETTETQKIRRARNDITHTLAWSPWHNNDKVFQSILVYRHAGLEFRQRLACSYPDVASQGNGIRFGKLRLIPHGGASVQETVADGPIIWTPMVNIQCVSFRYSPITCDH